MGPRLIDARNDAADRRHFEIHQIARNLMDQVGKLIPVLPVPLVATVLLRARDGLSEADLKAAVTTLVQALERTGARIYVPRSDWDYAVTAGLRMLVMRHLVLEQAGLFSANVGEERLLRYYANSMRHLLPEALRP